MSFSRTFLNNKELFDNRTIIKKEKNTRDKLVQLTHFVIKRLHCDALQPVISMYCRKKYRLNMLSNGDNFKNHISGRINMRKYMAHLIGEAKTILLATDGSPYAEGAVQEAIFLSQACPADLIVLYVIGVDSEVASSVHAKTTEKAREILPHLNNIKKMASDHDINCETVILRSYQPEKTIVKEAKKRKADIIIMGRHGKRGLRQLLVGSMTAKVIGQRFPMVLVVPKDYMISGNTILLATDGSKFSNMALKETISFAKKCPTLKNIIIISIAKREAELKKAKKVILPRNCAEVDNS
jgi:nucleotide-binding universal stress UspA family protein